MAQDEPSQAEIWDDSALVDSWNEAFEEYKKYHSLAAKGEKVNLEREGDLKDGGPPPAAVPLSQNPSTEQATSIINSREISLELEEQTTTRAQQTGPPPTLPTLPAMPQTLLGTAHNDELKNLMMSWYYAGYYTGLYEGKEQGYAAAREQGG